MNGTRAGAPDRRSARWSLTLACCLAMVLSSPPAHAEKEKRWSHKAWQVTKKDTRCTLSTGGDGDDYFRVSFANRGLDAAVDYEPLIIRGYPVPLSAGDEVELRIDGKPNWLGEEMSTFEDKNEWDEYRIVATLTTGFVPELVEALRRGNELEVGKTDASGSRTLAKFSLSGFTASLLKASEWCRFDPKKLPES